MFTKEQQTGSGQLNMIDQINEKQDRIKLLQHFDHTFFADPGHAWLKVRYQDLVVLGIHRAITGFSYRKGEDVYLEEDLDALTYLKAVLGGWNTPEYFHWKENHLTESYSENTFVRNLNGYTYGDH